MVEDAVRKGLVELSKIDNLNSTSLPRLNISLAIPNIAQSMEPPKKPMVRLMN